MATGTLGTSISYFRPDVLAGRVGLITGGGTGIGFEVARQFGLHGAKGVVLFGRRQAFLDEAVKLLADEGIKAVAVAGDVRKPEDCSRAVTCTIDAFGSLDILVNAAAGNFLAASEQLSPNAFKTVMDIDTMGVFNMTRCAFEPLRTSTFGGVVTSITATLHFTATWWQTAPIAAKAAIEAMTRNLALEWGDFGIRLNTLAPGPVSDTPGLQKLSGGMESKMKWDNIPIKRPGTKEEMASACIYFCLNQCITGHCMVVDGGEWFGKTPFLPREAVLRTSRGIEQGSRSLGPRGEQSKL
eukprot:TRINITY_DN34173_c0_g1_i1.p1 TRINITY_DN34173_c0_g1~~TRINITY_DN34173_c0_g1_i1.p1  ORF type:complete len:298 (-),score=52.30 TRINITY_DN34173_c0_g1_i1:263-1156(-)